ncbi:hypothetical protein ACJMK2_031635 [Sinanodonta woodiana]|uniref:Fucolectin tachylectin-4 pentraxin-1 domain-containing protein n=1 Tax=Sinanodonta woodiana TaxID=1069815 RepID=A0ABD3WZF2_SINWO
MFRKDITCLSAMRFTSCMRYIIFIMIFYCHTLSGLRNFALNKCAYQSSTVKYNNFDWTADKAVDGNTDSGNPDNSRTCSETAVRMGNHTWEVDIGFMFIVNHVLIYERSDGTDQLSGFLVIIGNNSNPWRTEMALQKSHSTRHKYILFADYTLARFVSVIRQNSTTLTLCEVEVYGECLHGKYSEFCNLTCGQCSNGEPCNKDTGECLNGCKPGWTGKLCDKGVRNFALNKFAYQSSTEYYNKFYWTADKAVDGNTDGRNPDFSRTCSETDIRMGIHTWEVDIGFMIIVKHVVIYERSDRNDQLSGFEVFIGNDSNSWKANKPLQIKDLGYYRYRGFSYDSLARFVSVIRRDRATLTLCEVEVYGECLDGKYTAFCNHTCGKCFNGEPCNKDTGECLHGCEPGWTGKSCDTDASAKLTQTLFRADLTVIGGSVAGACVGAIIIIIIIIAVLKRGRNTVTGDTEMKINETGVTKDESFKYTADKETSHGRGNIDSNIYCTIEDI